MLDNKASMILFLQLKSTVKKSLCKSKDNLIVEYALRDMNKPIGVSEYKLTPKLPEELKDTLPSIEEIKNSFKKP